MTLLWRPLAYPTPIIGHPTPCIPFSTTPGYTHCRLIPFFMLPYCCTDRCSSGCFAWIVAVGVLPLCCCCCCYHSWCQCRRHHSTAQLTTWLNSVVSVVRQNGDHTATKMHSAWTKQRTEKQGTENSKNFIDVCVCIVVRVATLDWSSLDPFIRRRLHRTQRPTKKKQALIAACNMSKVSNRLFFLLLCCMHCAGCIVYIDCQG